MKGQIYLLGTTEDQALPGKRMR
ncbi:conserved protein of unknown function [Ectopseudomonas oleovorans]|uniref:Uncharacterized protein n=1 Tax=Ectopseudomonas oleovorans TaxID=301 RepID=A0A653B286_ECTOL|nr:conserved protein of unknown function [Pseudomonas oleovorans]